MSSEKKRDDIRVRSATVGPVALRRAPLDRRPRSRAHVVAAGRYGAGSGWVLAELNACTPASLSPSNGVTGLLGPRQKSSSAGPANHMPTWLGSTRTRWPLTIVVENASAAMRWSPLPALPRRRVGVSPTSPAAP